MMLLEVLHRSVYRIFADAAATTVLLLRSPWKLISKLELPFQIIYVINRLSNTVFNQIKLWCIQRCWKSRTAHDSLIRLRAPQHTPYCIALNCTERSINGSAADIKSIWRAILRYTIEYLIVPYSVLRLSVCIFLCLSVVDLLHSSLHVLQDLGGTEHGRKWRIGRSGS